MRRIPQLDGLRGIAILLVVFGHAWDGVNPHNRRLVPFTHNLSGGGFMGVELFFVLSGFLITSLLLRELERTHRVDLRAFYVRRARRLLPALFTVAGAYTIFLLAAKQGVALRQGLGSVARAVTYTEDLAEVLPPINHIPSNGYLDHSWSLAVEEQFYLVWPIALLWALRNGGVRMARRVAVAAIGFVYLFRIALLLRGHPPYQITHWDALMAGCLVALLPAIKLPRYTGWLTVIVIAAITLEAAVIGQGFVGYGISAFICTIALIAALDAKALAHPVLRYFGRISYGLYLWHALILRFAWPVIPSVLVSVLIADLSYRYIESKFLLRRQRPEVPDSRSTSLDKERAALSEAGSG